jgi:hypothetical protein
MTSSFSSMLLASMLLFDVKKIMNKKEKIIGCGILVVLNFYWKVSSLPIWRM